MATIKSQYIIGIAISLLVIAVMLPIGINELATIGDTVVYNATDGTSLGTLTSLADPAIITILSTLLPIIAVIGILLYFVPKMRK